MCFDKRVIAALAATALAIFLFAPNIFGAALPLLVIAACPLSMLLMMRTMSGSKEGSSCPMGNPTTSSEDDEIAELRAEVERLRSQHAPNVEVTGAAQPQRQTPA